MSSLMAELYNQRSSRPGQGQSTVQCLSGDCHGGFCHGFRPSSATDYQPLVCHTHNAQRLRLMQPLGGEQRWSWRGLNVLKTHFPIPFNSSNSTKFFHPSLDRSSMDSGGSKGRPLQSCMSHKRDGYPNRICPGVGSRMWKPTWQDNVTEDD